MFPGQPTSRCDQCGVALPTGGEGAHACNEQQRLAHQILLAKHEIERIDDELGEYLRTPRGRFELWYAARHRRLADAA